MTSIVTSLNPIERHRAEILTSAHLQGGSVGNDISSDCALLRSCIWSLSGTTEPVHVLRVLNLALTMWDSDQDVLERREHLHEALEELAEAGDLVSLPEGRWLPAPTREVLLESGAEERLLVGGLPTGVLPAELKKLIVHHGPYRRVKGSVLGDALQLPKESAESWAGSPPKELESWADKILSVKLVPYVEQREGTRIRVYTPELARDRPPQVKRWFDRPAGISGRYLAVRERVFGAREYRIVELQNGAVVASNESLSPGDGRRLMYALDLRAGKPVDVQIGAKKGSLSVTLRSELPRSEQRLFGALGVLEVPEEDYYPRTWWFPECYRDIVQSKLQALRVKIVEGRTRRLS
jgi:hypothetical protein